MKAFFDNSISYRIAQALDLLAEGVHHVVALRDWPGSGGDISVADEVFLPVLKAEGDWVVFTADRGRRDANWHVWLASGLTVVFLKKGWNSPSMGLYEYAQRMLKHWPSIMQEVADYPPGTCFYLHTSGRLELVPRRRHQQKRG